VIIILNEDKKEKPEVIKEERKLTPTQEEFKKDTFEVDI